MKGTDKGYLRGEWESLARKALPDDVSALQLQEMKRSFYAGAHALIRLMLTRFEKGTQETEADLQFMDDIDAELNAYFQQVREGKA